MGLVADGLKSKKAAAFCFSKYAQLRFFENSHAPVWFRLVRVTKYLSAVCDRAGAIYLDLRVGGSLSTARQAIYRNVLTEHLDAVVSYAS